MPCTTFDGYQPSSHSDELHRLEKSEAILCAICTRLQAIHDVSRVPQGSIFDTALLSPINWKEVGVSKSWAENWWKQHQEKDQARRKKEQEDKELEERINTAKAKLTAEELALLGIK